MKIQLRYCKLTYEVYAVLYQIGDHYQCYCLTDNMHFDPLVSFVKKRTTPIREAIPELLQIVADRYPNEEIKNVNNIRKIPNRTNFKQLKDGNKNL